MKNQLTCVKRLEIQEVQQLLKKTSASFVLNTLKTMRLHWIILIIAFVFGAPPEIYMVKLKI